MPACPESFLGCVSTSDWSLFWDRLLLGLVFLLWSPLMAKLQAYAGFGFFSTYLIKPQVLRNEWIVGSIVLVWLRQRFSWQEFWRQREGFASSRISCCLLAFRGH